MKNTTSISETLNDRKHWHASCINISNSHHPVGINLGYICRAFLQRCNNNGFRHTYMHVLRTPWTLYVCSQSTYLSIHVPCFVTSQADPVTATALMIWLPAMGWARVSVMMHRVLGAVSIYRSVIDIWYKWTPNKLKHLFVPQVGGAGITKQVQAYICQAAAYMPWQCLRMN